MRPLFEDLTSSHTTHHARFEGCNISTWIGFKHVMYLVEEAVLAYLRDHKLAPRHLYETYGLCCEVVDSGVRIAHALYVDETVAAVVRPVPEGAEGELVFKVHLLVERDGKQVRAVSGTVKVLWRYETDSRVPEALRPYSYPEIRRPAPDDPPPPPVHIGRGQVPFSAESWVASERNSFVWRWRIPYFYCHFSKRIQHSGYLRILEEIVDLFLDARGISIRHMLETRAWIPVVPQARVEILQEALLEEALYSVYTVEDIFKDLTYTARLDCYVWRSGTWVHTATGRIVHGYATILGRGAWELATFDTETLTALRGPST